MSGFTIVYNEHLAVPEESVYNYIAEGRGGKNVIEEVIVDERVLRATFYARCLRRVAASRLTKVAHEGGGGTATLSGDKVIRAGNNERERELRGALMHKFSTH